MINKDKLNRFIKNKDITYFFDHERNCAYFLNQDKIPISFLNISNVYDDNYQIQQAYSKQGYGKILYYLALMETTKKGHKLTSADADEIRGHSIDIWLDIAEDETVGFIGRENYDPIDENDTADRFYFKEPDEHFKHIIQKKSEYSICDKKSSVIYDLARDTFQGIYEFDEIELIENSEKEPINKHFQTIIDDEIEIIYSESETMLVDKYQLPIACFNHVSGERYGSKEHQEIINDYIKSDHESSFIYLTGHYSQQEFFLKYNINEKDFQSLHQSFYQLSEDDILTKRAEILLNQGLKPTLIFDFFESEEEELSIQEESKHDDYTIVFIKLIKKINEYYKNNPVDILNDIDEMRQLVKNNDLVQNPTINVIFYDNNEVEESFDIYNDECGNCGFTALSDGGGIRKQGSNTFINSYNEIYIKVGKKYIENTILELKNLDGYNFTDNEIYESIFATLTHELKHMEDFLSLSGGNTPSISESLYEAGSLAREINTIAMGIDALDDNPSDPWRWIEERVEQAGRWLLKDIHFELEIKDLPKINTIKNQKPKL